MPDSSGIIDKPQFISAVRVVVPVSLLVVIVLACAQLAVSWSGRQVADAVIQTRQSHEIGTLYHRIEEAERRLKLLEVRARKIEVAFGLKPTKEP